MANPWIPLHKLDEDDCDLDTRKLLGDISYFLCRPKLRVRKDRRAWEIEIANTAEADALWTRLLGGGARPFGSIERDGDTIRVAAPYHIGSTEIRGAVKDGDEKFKINPWRGR